jgi:glycosyltransferase involved in cell wall biosynthesis
MAEEEATDESVSLIICTRDRADALERCLGKLPDLELAGVGAEVVLVDNGSSDRTAEVMAAFAGRAAAPVRIVPCEQPGLSRARNAGLDAARGTTLAFTDDDCYLAPGYVQRLPGLFSTGRFHFCGGRILPYDETDAAYGFAEDETFRRFPPGSFLPAGIVSGANLVLHRAVVDRIGYFDPMLGAGTPFRCEDIDYLARASLAGFAGAHVPALAVYHHHGRKPGADIESVKKANDVARGAYHAKLVAIDGIRPAVRWLYRSLRPWKAFETIRELVGARTYWAARRADARYRSGLRVTDRGF